MAKGKTEAEACGNCRFYRPRHQDDAALARAVEAGHPVPPGHCRRYPAFVLRNTEDWCGEYEGPG
jgi:hypothetical protein